MTYTKIIKATNNLSIDNAIFGQELFLISNNEKDEVALLDALKKYLNTNANTTGDIKEDLISILINSEEDHDKLAQVLKVDDISLTLDQTVTASDLNFEDSFVYIIEDNKIKQLTLADAEEEVEIDKDEFDAILAENGIDSNNY
ncbi:MAG TPA: hypothetical protein DIW15_00195 [Bavariicoccus seileri]|uniref:Uncharacterized protein n=1 Tax=Bavariicoccus seileri TaxID=549685 RepID=A0A3D4S2P6_9ENTE|nr:hypothetical protein [Bavariicoccus seileri]HCS93115.1 hypothetical protein [Bavariicoccus seileri]